MKRGVGAGFAPAVARCAWLALAAVLACARVEAVEINTATRAELERLDGLGVALADRILSERERAPFASWHDLARRVKGVRATRAARLQAQGATVNGQPARATATETPTP